MTASPICGAGNRTDGGRMSYWPGKAPAHDRTAETKKGPEGPFFYHYSTLLNAVAPYLERETRLPFPPYLLEKE